MTNTAIRYTPEFKQTLIDLHEKGHSWEVNTFSDSLLSDFL
jgi:hypothetical protein